MSSRLWLLTITLVFSTGCFPFIWATPPIKVEAGAALRNNGVAERFDGTFPLRAQAQPLQIAPSMKDRRFDFGVGWQFLPGTTHPSNHGPLLELGILSPDSPLPQGENDGMALRWGANVKGNWLFPIQAEIQNGWGVTLQGTVEWVRYAEGPFAGCEVDTDYDETIPPPETPYDPDPYHDDDDPTLTCATGYAEGEGGIGFFIETSYAHFPEGDLVWVGAGLIFRIPASLGFGFATIW